MHTIILLFTIICVALTANADLYSQEIQTALDLAGKIEIIDAELAKELDMSGDYSGFREARLFQVSDSLFVLEILYRPRELTLRERLNLSVIEVEEFQQKVTGKVNERTGTQVLDQSGRTKLIVGSLTLSMGYYGWAVPMTLDVHDGKTALALYMLTSGAGFYFPISATRNIPVTDAATTLALYGGTRGICHGAATAHLLDDKPSARTIVGSGLVFSVVEDLYGFNFASKSGISTGTAETICAGGDFGLGLGLGMAHLANFFDRETARATSASILLGSGLGIWGGNWLAERHTYTRGDAYVLRAAGLLGAYIPVALVDLVGIEEEKTFTAFSMLGCLVGLGIGDELVSETDFTTGQGVFIGLSELAGALIAAGLAYLVSEDDDDNTIYLTSSAIGAMTGFWLMHKSANKQLRKPWESDAFNFRIMPESLLIMALNKRNDKTISAPLPLITLGYRF